jgi:hypothetical protein
MRFVRLWLTNERVQKRIPLYRTTDAPTKLLTKVDINIEELHIERMIQAIRADPALGSGAI